jgi:hypothetical protein
MKKVLIGLTALALVAAAPLTAEAKSGKGHDVKNAARYCKGLRTALGADLFRQTYGGGSHAFGKCVSQRVHELRAARREARQACRSERGDHGAFKKCVRAQLRTATADDDENVTNAAKQCAAEREDDPAAFQDKYGTNHNKRNAFGKCVSSRADDEDENENEPEDADDDNDEQEQPGDQPGAELPEPNDS